MSYIDDKMKDRARKALESDRNMPLGNIFYVINKSFCSDDAEFITKLRHDELNHTLESISRAVRKLRELNPELRHDGWKDNQTYAKEVAQEMITTCEFNTTMITQESFI